MASTNHTTNYELSQFIGTDKPAWLGDYNSDMGKIDAQMKLNADSASTADGKATSGQEWVATNQGTGDFFESIKVDPALCAAVAVHMDESLVLPETILRDEQDIVVGQRADEAHLHFLKDQDYWDRVICIGHLLR